jgi:ubiquinone/menaquinone biosynthesis C-methylase UbiE
MVKAYLSYSGEEVPEGFEKHSLADILSYVSDDESVDEYMMIGIYDKVPDPLKLMKEVYRALRPGGKCTLVCPYAASSDAWQSPDTVRAVSEVSLNWVNREFRKAAKWEHLPDVNFEIQTGFTFDPQWMLKSEDSRNQALPRNINVARAIHLVLTKK